MIGGPTEIKTYNSAQGKPPVKRVLFHEIALRHLFNQRDPNQTREQYQNDIEISLLFLSLYFDEIVFAPGAFFVAFNKNQRSTLAHALEGDIAKMLLAEGMLFTYGDHTLQDQSSAERDWTGQNSYSRRLIARYQEENIFYMNGDQNSNATKVQLSFFDKMKPLPRPIVRANKATLLELRSLVDEYTDHQSDFLKRLLENTVSEEIGFNHQQMLWAWSQNMTTTWSENPRRSEDIMFQIERTHQKSKINNTEPVYQYGDYYDLGSERRSGYVGRRFNPRLLQSLLSIMHGSDFTEYLKKRDADQLRDLIRCSKEAGGFQEAYHAFLAKLSLDDIVSGEGKVNNDFLKNELLTKRPPITSLDTIAVIAAAALSSHFLVFIKAAYNIFRVFDKKEADIYAMKLNHLRFSKFLTAAMAVNQKKL